MSTMTDLKTIPPGEMFSHEDGNGNPLDDVRFPAPGEDQDFLLDADGLELRVGDHALVIDHPHWAEKYGGKVVQITSIGRGRMHRSGGYLHREDEETGAKLYAWSPSASTNQVGIQFRRSSTGIKPTLLRKVNLDEEAGLRLRLADLLDERADFGHQAAALELERVRVSVGIGAIREQIRALTPEGE